MGDLSSMYQSRWDFERRSQAHSAASAKEKGTGWDDRKRK